MTSNNYVLFARFDNVPSYGTDVAGSACNGGQVSLAGDRRKHGEGRITSCRETTSQVRIDRAVHRTD